jgi:hypothetical protein
MSRAEKQALAEAKRAAIAEQVKEIVRNNSQLDDKEGAAKLSSWLYQQMRIHPQDRQLYRQVVDRIRKGNL